MSLLIKALRKGSRHIQKLELQANQELVMGRSTKKLGLEGDPRLSRKHFKLQYTGDEIVVTHLSKTNPTLIAEEGIEDFRPVTGDCSVKVNCRIIAGSYRFQLELLQAIQEESFYKLTEDANDVSQQVGGKAVSQEVTHIDSNLAEGDWRSSECHLGEVPDFVDVEPPREAETKINAHAKTVVSRHRPDADEDGPESHKLKSTFNDELAKKPVERVKLTPLQETIEFESDDAAPAGQQPQKTDPADDKLVFPIDDDFFD